jgi:predicted AAA+ superfamily ATPase
MADTGLLFSLAFSETEIMDNEVYKSILFDKLHLNEGMFMENIVAQMLVSSGNRLFFYSKNSREDANDRIEIDFLIAEGRKIAPLEIKSARYQQHVSLDKFTAKYKERIGSKYIVYTKDLMVNDGVTFIPVYMTSLI